MGLSANTTELNEILTAVQNLPPGRSSADITISGPTVSIPNGIYSSTVTKTVASGTVGTPIATKGVVSNHAVTVTPSVTNTTGYITGGTKTGTGVSVSASELVSGNKALSSSASDQTNIDVANYSTVSISKIASGSAGTPTITSTASDHAITITPKVTNSTGYITGGTITGASVTVSASDLVSGTYTVSNSGTADVTDYKDISVAAGNVSVSTEVSGGSASMSVAGMSTATSGSYYVTLNTSAGSSTPKATRTAGYIAGGTVTGSSYTVPVSGDGDKVYIKAGSVTAGGSATSGSASVSITGMATATSGSYYITLNTTAGSYTPKASQTAGYITGATITGTAATVSVSGNGTKTYIKPGNLGAGCSVTSGSASMTATGVATATTGSHYITLNTTAGKATGTASVNSEGYVKTETASSGEKTVSVSGNGNKLYIAETSAAKSGGTVSWGTGYISAGSKTVTASDLGLGTVSSLTKSGGTVSLAKNKYSTSNLSTTVTPSDLGLSTVSALTKSGGTVSIDANKYGTSKLTTTVTAADVTSGTISITSTAATDVTNYASAQVSDANLVAGNIAKDVNILGVIGTLNPKKAEIGIFVGNQDVQKTISHTLGQVPDFVLFLSPDVPEQKVFKSMYGGWSKKTLDGQPTSFPGQVSLSLSSGSPTSKPTITKQTAQVTLTSNDGWGAPHSATATQFTVGGNSSVGYLAGTYFWIAMIF